MRTSTRLRSADKPAQAPAQPSPSTDTPGSADAELDDLVGRHRFARHGLAWRRDRLARRCLAQLDVGLRSFGSAIAVAEAYLADYGHERDGEPS